MLNYFQVYFNAGLNLETATTGSTKSSSMKYTEWKDSVGKAEGTKVSNVSNQYTTVSEVKVPPEKTQVVEVQNVKQLGNVVYDNQSKQKPSSVTGSVVHIKRNPRDGSYYMRADGSGEVKYVYRK